ncbi:AAA family ATPase [Actinoplanes sandaracinus]
MSVDDESRGTLVWFGLAGPVLTALAEGSVLLAHELDASLHPALVVELVRLFQDPATNPARAQLIFNSHDAALLGEPGTVSPLGRDQVWFTEKRDDGGSRLYGLADLAPRKEEAIGRRYLAGRYGAVPILSRQQFADAVRPATAEHSR